MVLGNGHAKLQECDVGKEQEKMASHVHFEEGNTSNNGKNTSPASFTLSH